MVYHILCTDSCLKHVIFFKKWYSNACLLVYMVFHIVKCPLYILLNYVPSSHYYYI